ncbi:phosphodiester glycosidase family protein [Sphingobacterium paucimobilis]|uniref:phosphodiester glycosidase family protein n=1 Tax=Sphingobacterium paucimobilis TaxID=1385985 RepID=UPI000429FE12|nr:phosphodiester glycosidase family protein [Sphingobacterium paucimobilis]
MEKLILLYLSLSTVFFSCDKKEHTVTIDTEPTTELVQQLKNKTNLISRVYSDSLMHIANGVDEIDVHYLSMNGYTTRAFILRVDLNVAGNTIIPVTAYGAEDPTTFQPVRDMLSFANVPDGKKIVGAVNGDFFDAAKKPMSVVHLDGKIIKSTMTYDYLTFLGFTATGNPIMGGIDEYTSHKNGLYNAIGGFHRLVKEGAVTTSPDLTSLSSSRHPRTAAGYTKDNILYFAVVDGRKFDYSNGLTIPDLAQFMYGLGCEEAINLDGGGSSTFIIRHPKSATYQVRNRVSDGYERSVGNGWVILSNN